MLPHPSLESVNAKIFSIAVVWELARDMLLTETIILGGWLG